MKVHPDIKDVRQVRWQEPLLQWGLVPTMGYLHEGHLSLVHRARQENDRVAVSIFVNPAQFNKPSDLAHYPRDLERDLNLLREHVDLVWTPTPEVVYPPDYQTYIQVEKVSLPLEGAARPGHFRGVATVVAKLFNVFQPQRAYFGQKDAQQVTVIKQMVRDLNFNLEIKVCPTIREADGLAMSSRNVNLSPTGRKKAACLYQALLRAKETLEGDQIKAEELRQQMRSLIERVDGAQIDYISVADPISLEELDRAEKGALLSLAVFIEGVRLIDNLLVERGSSI